MGNDRNERRARSQRKPLPAMSGGNPFGGKARGENAISYSDFPRLGVVVDAVVAAGRALTLSRTRDGGALAITVLDGDERHRAYAATEDEMNDCLTALFFAYGEPSPGSEAAS